MKRNILYLILINIVFFGFINNVDAALDLRISSSSSTRLVPGANYNVTVSYVDLNNRGTLNGLEFDMTFQNANCSITSGSCNQSNHCTFSNVKKGANLVQLSCVKSNSNESFIVSNIVGKNSSGNLNLRLASLSISTITTATSSTSPSTEPVVETTSTSTTTKKTTKKTTTSTTTTTTTEATTELITTPLPEFNKDEDIGELKLKNLKIIGYDFSFNKDTLEYTIKVKENVKELDVVATPLGRNIAIENTGKINIENTDQIEVNLLRDEERLTYLIKIERVKVRKINFSLYVIVILAIFVVSGLIVMQLINRRRIKQEEIDFFKEVDYGKEDAKILEEEEEEFTKTFFDLNKR